YRGQEAIARQIADLRRALEQQPHVEAFLPDPFLTDVFGDPALGPAEKDARAELFTEATNRALRGIPPERVRFHTCYGINEGPRIPDASLADVLRGRSRSGRWVCRSRGPTRATSTSTTSGRRPGPATAACCCRG